MRLRRGDAWPADEQPSWEGLLWLAQRSVELDPTNYYRLNTLGAMLVRQGQPRDAIDRLEESSRIFTRTNPRSMPMVEDGPQAP